MSQSDRKSSTSRASYGACVSHSRLSTSWERKLFAGASACSASLIFTRVAGCMSDTSVERAGMLLLSAFFVTGCSLAHLAPAASEKCPEEHERMPSVSVAEALQLSSRGLACYGSELIVDCGLLRGIKDDDRAACQTYVSAVVTYLSRDSCAVVRPSRVKPVTFEDAGVCIDTFIPGRELDDCFDFIQARIPLVPAAESLSGP
jgi:hypothetical protein